MRVPVSGMPQSGVIREVAPAKVNLSLRILGRRPDGYHELESLIAFATSVADEILFTPGEDTAITTGGRFADQLTGENIIESVLRAIAEIAPSLRLGSVRVIKNLPVAAGIGGGSADAAAVIRAVRAANPDDDQQVDWPALAARLGADVPVCASSRACHVQGIGDAIAPLRDLPRLAVVLVNTLQAMPRDKTAQVFRRLSAPPLDETRERRAVQPNFASADELIAHISETGNDLTLTAQSIAPDITDVIEVLKATGCRYAALSGAGPTCFGVYDGISAAQGAADAIAEQQPDWWVAASELS